MVRLFVVLGFALLAGGAYAIVDGWPYRVLERGFTEVILGGLSMVAGLILLALAAVLAEVRRLKGLVSGAMAAVALSEPRVAERPVPATAPSRPEPVLEKAPASDAGSVGIATTLAAGAGAAAVVGALTSLGKAEDKPDEKNAIEAADEDDKAEGDERPRSDRAELPSTVVAEPSQAPVATAGDIDDWLLPPVAPVLDIAPADVRPNERDESREADEKAEDAQDKPKHLDTADIDEASHPADEKVDDIAEPDAAVDEPEAGQDEDERDDASKLQAAPATSSEEQLWWPRIDHSARSEPSSSVDDEFNALRDQLAGVVNAPEVEPPRRDRDNVDTAESWIAPRAWPPVTQPRDPGALSEVEAEAADKVPPEEAKGEPTPLVDEASQSEPEPELAAEPAIATMDESPVEKTEPSAAEAKPEEAKPNEEPAASNEGVIGAYQVGETQFTMFADGSIHARTPDGDYVFASMDELKTYLASEKDKLGA
ncbi:conserved hypothetical protein [Bosea sp. 62]|uniref:hypothetical protein n=1 Tax=unclassified Bosea (in: a-proteobacteria) TaxID=2653178 RepID=UPI0012527D52|nr:MULTISPECIES: hypothetical protein [unclassified Bosea (in: a-proteobacteria)]CAD5293006.1 conserved hypothetical protein [Bosea sp. 7B]CAD5298761.1 conserved hypothetical protein [Bosea sp. 21B]CAD5298923.1 conserved hypothetical protein [Bosea sp. 46]VVT61533.1 conserved hypothetical protein [Bosea sp. EC-HK365B]VXB11412.1 conserved hypothetical protein [Bosea sp. 127]